MDSYIAKRYARKLDPSEASVVKPHTWYLPHFAVVNANKPSKIRMVFDAAAEVNGVSLNSMLLKGPQEYRPLPSILFHFREGAVGVSGDIKEMFHQVLMQPEDRCAQRFLWRNGDSGRQPDVYEMCVMTFGAACSPCAAHYVKTRNALEHRINATSRAVQSILAYHYVDAFVDAFDSPAEAISIAQEVRAIHLDAGFELRNFASNSPEVAAALGGAEDTKLIASKEGLATEKVLGLYWQPSTDKFKFNLHFNKVDPQVVNGGKRPTKRELLSVVMSVFDPLGFLSHFIIGAKLIMREVWRRNTRWDEPLPSDIGTVWERWRKQLLAVTKYAIPSFYFCNGKPKDLQLHIFVDASEDAFAAVAYWRVVNYENEVSVSFVCAKTKCAPLKPLTIPRLELQAAVLGTRLMQTIREEHSVVVNDCLLWSDSSTVMKWIRSEHRRYKPFVQHRVAEILASTSVSDWRWVPTADNVADEATRFSSQVDFTSTSRWIQGPPFLRQEECYWPTAEVSVTQKGELDEELRPKYAMVIVSSRFLDFDRFSTFNRLVRTVAWVLHFINLCRHPNSAKRRYGLTSADVEAAKLLIWRLVQNEHFGPEIGRIRKVREVARNSPLRQLSPYVDEEGTLRVCGRIDAASWLPMSARRPIILQSKHPFTKLVVAHHHNLMRHQNIEATICTIRQTYWVLRLRTVLRSVIASCQVCRLSKAAPVPPLMGPLPVDRLTAYVRPFSSTGLDYFGPLTVTVRRSTEKIWVALFTCLTVRAVHLELAHDLSTDSCIIAIRNFINRRGADNEAKRFNEIFDCQRVQDELAQKGVEWVFNAPFNPAEGGAWERMVQSVKRVLRRTLKEVAPREHTLNCFLIEAENVINSRPLTHLPISVDQEQPLTPNDFLLGCANTVQTPVAADVLEGTCVLRQQWRIARQLRDHFWKRWVSEYLPTLTRRVKRCERTTPLKEGDLVFICDPNVPRREWVRGKVEQLHPGRDGEIRRADIRTSTGIKQRAVSKLAILDVAVGESDRSTGAGMSQHALSMG
ncbi:uncharacterized protein LOC118741953 [Rhagoletis pomonella]|uniref:uncharacterized protein LOC118741953 n=1 Tax=Rhagoletis pomonella TaxID=28610 RepID=UPI00177C2DAF|nr:uncharacterized protein LOC118741953 [Rhagoletis pomonella]